MLTCFTLIPVSDWVECGSLGCRSTCNSTDWCPRIVDGCPIEFSYTNVIVNSATKFVSDRRCRNSFSYILNKIQSELRLYIRLCVLTKATNYKTCNKPVQCKWYISFHSVAWFHGLDVTTLKAVESDTTKVRQNDSETRFNAAH